MNKLLRERMGAEARNEDGFTLIELMVVLLIIGILAAIAIPVYFNQQKAGYETSLKTDLTNARDFLNDRFTVEAGYPTTLDGTSVSDGNTITLYGGGKTVSTATGGSTGTTGLGNTGNTKPATERVLTPEEFDEVNQVNTGTPYTTFIDDTNAAFDGVKYVSTFIYTAEQLNSLTATENAFKNACAYVESKTPQGYTTPTFPTQHGKNNCYTYASNAVNELTVTRDDIKVINEFGARQTPSSSNGVALTDYNFSTGSGFYVVTVTKNAKSNNVWGGPTSVSSDITVYNVEDGNSMVSKAPNLICDPATVTGVDATNIVGSRNYCGSPAVASTDAPDSFWELGEVPEIPDGLLEGEALAGDFGAFCVEGHNENFGANEGWYHIAASDGKLKTGKC